MKTRLHSKFQKFVNHFLFKSNFSICLFQIVVHPKWNFTDKHNDVALMQFTHRINFTQNIIPIQLLNNSQSLENHKCLIAGWGRTGTEGNNIILRKASLNIIPNSRCAQEWIQFDKRRGNQIITEINESQICAGDESDVSACSGDSGGPLICLQEEVNVLAGVISFGDTLCTELSRDLSSVPNVFTRISHYYNWINSIIDNN